MLELTFGILKPCIDVKKSLHFRNIYNFKKTIFQRKI